MRAFNACLSPFCEAMENKGATLTRDKISTILIGWKSVDHVCQKCFSSWNAIEASLEAGTLHKMSN